MEQATPDPEPKGEVPETSASHPAEAKRLKATPRRVRQTSKITIAALSAVTTLILPLTLVAEFGWDAYWNFYIPYYPHIAAYPVLLFWGASLCLFAVWNTTALDRRRIRTLAMFAPAILVVALIVTYLEQEGDNMMVLEFSPTTQQTYCMTQIVRDAGRENTSFDSGQCKALLDLARTVGTPTMPALSEPSAGDGSSVAINYSDAQGSKLYNELFRYDRWRDQRESLSVSRMAYVFTVFGTTAVILATYFHAIFLRGRQGDSMRAGDESPFAETVRDQCRVMLYGLCVAIGAFFLWIPFRVNYNVMVKARLFAESGVRPEYFNFGPTEFFICVLSCVFAVLVFSEMFGPNSNLLGFLVTLGAFIGPVLGFTISNPAFAADLFGFSQANKLMLGLWPLLMFVIVWYFVIRFPLQRPRKKRRRKVRAAV